ncbi:MAG TPA: type II secretion system F family protein [Actinomycetota bacterium]|nr:type II secretion system F family protein [Actinomycetota bacterium]
MSDRVFLAMAVLGTFVAVLLSRVAWMASSRSREPSQVLEAQLHSAGVALPAGPSERFSERVVAPIAGVLARLAARLTPAGAQDKIAGKLVLAGSPEGWTAERVLALKGLGLVLGLLVGYVARDVISVPGAAVVVPAAFGSIGYLLPGATLSQAVIRRQEVIRRSLSDTIDLLTISVEAGLSLDAALLHVRRTMKGPLSEEIGRMLHEIQLGVSRTDALRHLSERTQVSDLKGFVLAMVQADIFGVSIANVLRSQAHELRIRRRQHAEERAMKMPAKLLFPMIFCILPALFIVILGPAAIQIFREFIVGNAF